MNKILNIAGKIVYVICMVPVLVIVEVIAAFYMMIYKAKI